MLIYGITDIQNKPSLIKSMHIAQIVDKRNLMPLNSMFDIIFTN